MAEPSSDAAAGARAGAAARLRSAHRTAGPIATPATRNSEPRTSQPATPPPITSVVSSSGPSIRAIETPVPKKPWYWPCWPAGARSKLISHDPDACIISPATWIPAPASRITPAAQAGVSAAVRANTAQAANITRPACRTSREALASPFTRRATRTWNSTTLIVLIISSAETIQRGASVRLTIHSGSTRLSSGMLSSMIMLRNEISAYGRSRSTASFGPPTTAGAAATLGRRSRTSAASRKATASIAKIVRYAALVSNCSANPPSPAPIASPAFRVDCRYALASVRFAGSTSPASSACRAAPSPHWQHA